MEKVIVMVYQIGILNMNEENQKTITILELKKAFNEYLQSKGFTHMSDKQIQWAMFWDKVKGRIK